MSIKFYHNNAYRELTGAKIRYGNQWRELHGDDRMYLDGKWHYLDAGYELYWRETQKPFRRIGDRSNWVDVIAAGDHCCFALNNRQEAYAIELDGDYMVKLADGIVKMTNTALIQSDGRHLSYSAYFNRKKTPQTYVSSPSERTDIVPDWYWAVSTAGKLLRRSYNSGSPGGYIYEYEDESNWLSVQCGDFWPEEIGARCLGVALNSDGQIAFIDDYGRRWNKIGLSAPFVYVGKIHHDAWSGSRVLALTDTKELHSFYEGRCKIDDTESPWYKAASAGGSSAFAINEAGSVFEYDNLGLQQIDAGNLHFVDIAAEDDTIYGIVRVTD